jgi:Rubrerythrin
MDLSNAETAKNLESAFGGESMANRKYLFFAEVTKKLGLGDLSKLFRETANQETEHAFAHFRLLHPELVVTDPETLIRRRKEKNCRPVFGVGY